MRSITSSKKAALQDKNARHRASAAKDAESVVIDRRDPDFWKYKGQLESVVLRDPCFAIEPDTGNS